MSKSRQIQNWIMRAAGILLCMVLVSTYLVCGMFARYTTSASGSDGARVAKFNVADLINGSSVTQPIAAALAPGIPYKAVVTVNNDSEVAVEYTVDVLQETDNLVLQFRMVSDPNDSDTPWTPSHYTFSADLTPGQNVTYYLEVDWVVASNAEALANMGKVDQINITLSATQID